MARKSRISWRRLLAKCGPLFLARDSRASNRVERVARLCDAVRDYVLRSISQESGDLDPEAASQFIDRLPAVLGQCDDDIYDLAYSAEAYAFVHLVDRYRRFWDVLEILLQTQDLPIRDASLDVLDVGTGPAPALYAVNDFFEELRHFSKSSNDCKRLATPPPRLRSIENSRAMVHLVHNLSEFTGRPGPFYADRPTFEGFNPPEARAAERLRRIDELLDNWDYSEQEARIQVHLDQSEWQSIGRYHLCIFSNFLTRIEQVSELASELYHVFRALKPGGIVVVVGGTRQHYPGIYDSIDEVAMKAKAQRVRGVPLTVPCDYQNQEADLIKQLYDSVFEALGKVRRIDDSELPPDLWNPSVPLKGPTSFGIRVYRAPNRPPGARFTRNTLSRRSAENVG